MIRHTNTAVFQINDGAHFENSTGGVYDLAGDGTIVGLFHSYAYRGYFSNYGLLRKSSGTNSVISAPFNNLNGSIEVDNGTLSLTYGGSSSNGTFNVAAGATLDLTGGSGPTWTGMMTGSGAGTVSLNSGSIAANPNLTLNLPGGLFQWTGGAFTGTVTNIATVTIAGTNSETVGGGWGSQGVFYNQGLVRHADTARFQINDGSHFENLAGGVYDLAGDGNIAGLFHGLYGYGYFSNYGLLRKNSGTNSVVSGPFNNLNGVIEVDSGTLRLAGSGISSNGTFIVASGAVLDLTGGNGPTWAGTVTGSGAGTVSLSSGRSPPIPILELNLPNGLFCWTGGTFSGTTINSQCRHRCRHDSGRRFSWATKEFSTTMVWSITPIPRRCLNR